MPYTGAGSASSALAFDKERSKAAFVAAGVPTADYQISTLAGAAPAEVTIPLPLVMKPLCEGSSVGVHIIGRIRGIAAADCGSGEIRGDRAGGALYFRQGTDGGDSGGSGAADHPHSAAVRILRYFQQISMDDGVGRVGLLMPGGPEPGRTTPRCRRRRWRPTGPGRGGLQPGGCAAGRGGDPWVLEVNTIPGMTSTSLLPKAARRRASIIPPFAPGFWNFRCGPTLNPRSHVLPLFRRADGEPPVPQPEGGAPLGVVNVPPSRKEVAMRRPARLCARCKWAGIAGAAVWGVVPRAGSGSGPSAPARDYAVGQFELVTNGAITVHRRSPMPPDCGRSRISRNWIWGPSAPDLLTLPRVSRAERGAAPCPITSPSAWRNAVPPHGWPVLAGAARPMTCRGLLLDRRASFFPAGVMLNEYTALARDSLRRCLRRDPRPQGAAALGPAGAGIGRSGCAGKPWPSPMSSGAGSYHQRFHHGRADGHGCAVHFLAGTWTGSWPGWMPFSQKRARRRPRGQRESPAGDAMCP